MVSECLSCDILKPEHRLKQTDDKYHKVERSVECNEQTRQGIIELWVTQATWRSQPIYLQI